VLTVRIKNGKNIYDIKIRNVDKISKLDLEVSKILGRKNFSLGLSEDIILDN